MRVSSQQIFNQSLQSLLGQQAELNRTQAQLASGERVLTPADDPTAAARIVDMDRHLADLDQYQRNLDVGQTRLALEEGALADSENLVQRARELAVQAGSSALSDSDRRDLAIELRHINEQFIQIANSSDGYGRYLFGGFSDSSQPFEQSAGGSVVFAGDQGRRTIQVAPGREVPDGDSGFDVFMSIRPGNGTFKVDQDTGNTGTGVVHDLGVADPATYVPHSFEVRFTASDSFDVVDVDTGASVLAAQPYQAGSQIAFNGARISVDGAPEAGDVFHVQPSRGESVFNLVSGLADSLEAGAVGTVGQSRLDQTVANALNDLDRTLDHLSGTRAQVGARLQSLDNYSEANDVLALRANETLSELRDLDYAEAVTRFTRYLTGLEAAQKTFAQVQSLSLFDRLP